MGLLSQFVRRQELSTVNPANWFWYDNIGPRTAAGPRVNAENALQVSAVLACVKVLSETLATLPLKVYRKKPSGGRVEAENLPLYSILHRRPNRYQTAFEWIEMMMNHLCLRGNAYFLKVAGVDGPYSELMPLHPDCVQVKQDLRTKEYYYEYRNEDGTADVYTLDEVLHIRGMPSRDGMVGLSPIGLARESVGLAKATEAYGGSLFANGAVPKVALHTDQPLKPDEKRVMEGLWHSNYGGQGNQNKTAVLSHGLKIQTLSINPDEAQFLETRQYQLQEIARIFRVPLHLVGDLSRSTNNNIEHQSLEFVQYTMLPWCRRIETAINRSILSNYGDRYYCEFTVEGLLRGDASTRATLYRELFNIGVYSVNDILSKENENPIGDEGDKRFVNAALVDLKVAGDPNLGKPDVPASPSPDTRTPTQQNSEAKAKARLMVMAELSKLLRWEVAETNKLSNHPKEFSGKLEAFHEDHAKRMTDKLTPLCELLDLMGEKCVEKLENAIKSHFSASLSVILSASECPADKLTESVAGVTEKWDSRALEFVEQLGI